MNVLIRKAERKDVAGMIRLIKELATYEKALEEVTNTEELMEEEGFGSNPAFYAHVAEVDGNVAGVAIYYISYSTWKGKSIYLDDIVVSEKFRRFGIGKKLFDAVGEFAKSVCAHQLRWHVLDWNEPAIKFYKKYYSPSMDEAWITCKLEKDQVESSF